MMSSTTESPFEDVSSPTSASSTSPLSPAPNGHPPPALSPPLKPSSPPSFILPPPISDPLPPLHFSLSTTPDPSAPVLSSITSLTSSLSSILTSYHSLHRSRLSAYLTELHQREAQRLSLQSSIDLLRSSLTALADERSRTEAALTSLRSSVASSQSSLTSLLTAVTDSTLRLDHLRSKATKRDLHRSRPPHLTLTTHLTRPSATSLRLLRAPLTAIDRIFTYLPVRDVAVCMRTSRLWLQVIGRSGVWRLSMRRVLHNKKKKEKEVEDSGEQLTRDEFDDWRTTPTDPLDTLVPLPSHHFSADEEEEPAKPAKAAEEEHAFVLSPAAASALNLPSHDLPVPEHLHFALTVDIGKEACSVSIASRRVSTLYACAAMMDTLHPSPGKPAPALPKTTTVVLCCPLVPKAGNAAELSFCQTVVGLSEQMEVAKADVERLGRQLEEDAAVKRRLQAELEEREEEVRKVQAELDMETQQSMSDEMTRQFLEENVREVEGQVEEEEGQTRGLREMLREAYRKREEEVAGMEREAEGMEREVEQLREEKGKLTREVKQLQNQLEDLAGDKERAKREYEKLLDLVEQLRAL